MSATIEQLREQGWDNCNGCGYFYSKQRLEHCPMCHHARHEPKSYSQPAWESPGLT